MDSNSIKKNIEKTFNDVSSRYDENRFFSISAKKMAELVPLNNEMRVLDLSTGTGAVAIEVAKKYKHADVEAIDLSQGMLDKAKAKAKENNICNISYKRCDVDKVDYHPEIFDVVTCGYGIFFYPDMENTYKNICKTIKPGGVFIFSTFTKEAFNPFAELFLNRIENNYNIETPSRLRERLKTRDQVEKLAATAKHKKIEVIHYPIRYKITVNEWWSLLNNAAYKSLLDQLDYEQLQAFKDEHIGEIEELSMGGLIELNADTLFGVVHI